jgi:hypothetical protein
MIVMDLGGTLLTDDKKYQIIHYQYRKNVKWALTEE